MPVGGGDSRIGQANVRMGNATGRSRGGHQARKPPETGIGDADLTVFDRDDTLRVSRNQRFDASRSAGAGR